MLAWESIAFLGRPVVPEVYIITAQSASSYRAGGNGNRPEGLFPPGVTVWTGSLDPVRERRASLPATTSIGHESWRIYSTSGRASLGLIITALAPARMMARKVTAQSMVLSTRKPTRSPLLTP